MLSFNLHPFDPISINRIAIQILNRSFQMRVLFCIILISLLCACGKSEAPPPLKIMESQRQQLQKAKDVEKTMLQAAEIQRQEIDTDAASQTAK